MKILVIDDSATMRSIQSGILRKLGYNEIQEACDGVDALSKLDSFSADLLLVDVDMPSMDGLSFTKHYREQHGTARIILVTNGAERGRLAEAIEAGVNNTIAKPISPNTLSRSIEETLKRCEAA